MKENVDHLTPDSSPTGVWCPQGLGASQHEVDKVNVR
jgi:hypothetical protein